MSAPLRRIGTSTLMVLRDLSRNRTALLLLVAVPTTFFVLIQITTGDREIPFRLSAAGRELLTAGERPISLLFIGMAAVSGLSAFLAFVLVLRPAEADRRLVFEGFRSVELLGAKVLVMLVVAVVVAAYVMLLLPVFFRPQRPTGVLAGYVLTSITYGVFGLLVGSLVRRELEGILLILLLVNIDAGWLQNPVFFENARNQELIRWLPGHHPGQVAMLSAFTGVSLGGEIAKAFAYAALGLAIAAVLYWRRVRVSR